MSKQPKAIADGSEARAKRLMDQVMQTWNPPLLAGNETDAMIAQTSTMLAIAYIMGKEFLPHNLTNAQRAAVESGLAVYTKHLD